MAKKTIPERKIVEIKKWTVEQTIYEDGRSSIYRKNEGFNPMELLGILSYTEGDILDQVRGHLKPNIIEKKIEVVRPVVKKSTKCKK